MRDERRRVIKLAAVIFLACVIIPLSTLTQAQAALEGPDSDLVGWWRFDEGSGTTVADASGNGNTGTFTGTAPSVCLPRWASGKFGGGVYLATGSPSDNYPGPWIEIKNPFGAPSWSLSLWINPEMPATPGKPYYNGYGFFSGDAGAGSALGMGNDCVRKGDGTRLANFSFASESGWHHVVVIYDGSNFLTAVDGQIRGVRADTPNLLALNASRRIGRDFKGSIDEVRLYKRALSLKEIAILYNPDNISDIRATRFTQVWTVPKAKFAEVDAANGTALADALLAQGVLAQDSLGNGYLNVTPGEPLGSIRRPPEMSGNHFDEIWNVLSGSGKLPSWMRYSHLSFVTDRSVQWRLSSNPQDDFQSMPYSISDYSPYERYAKFNSIYIKDLQASTTDRTYTYYARCVDEAGNVRGPYTVSVVIAGDTTPPDLFSSVTASSVREDSADITWLTNEPATSLVEYGTTPAYGMVSIQDDSLALPHAVILTGLSPNTAYHYRVRSQDAVGQLSGDPRTNEAVSADYTFTTPAVIIPSNASHHIYVDVTNGSDSNSGTKVSPVQSLSKAQTLVRGKPGSIVWIRKGTYYLNAPLSFGVSDSGAPGNPIVWRAYPGEEVRISAGKMIHPTMSNWHMVSASDAAYPRLPAATQGHVIQCDLSSLGIDYGIMDRRGAGISRSAAIADLYADTGLLQVSRWPNPDDSTYSGGWLTVDQQVVPYTFKVKESFSPKSWQSPTFGGTVRKSDFSSLTSNTNALWDSLIANGYIDPTGTIQFGFMNLFNDYPSMKLDPAFETIKPQVYTTIRKRTNSVWVYGLWANAWATTYENVSSMAYDSASRKYTITCATGGSGAEGWSPGQFSPDKWFYFGNILEELDQPGEYYIDRNQNLLYLWPLEGYRGNYYLTYLDNAVSIMNAQDITFRDIIFEGARLSGISITSSGSVVNSRLLFQNITLRNMGFDGARFSSGSKSRDCGFLSSKFHSIGRDPIAIRGYSRPDPKAAEGGRNFVENCEISDFSMWVSDTGGIFPEAPQTRIMHNHIHHGNAYGIYSQGGFNALIAYNEFDHLEYDHNDGGFIYIGPYGAIVKYNYLHDGLGFRGQGVVGVYIDNVLDNVSIFGNILSGFSPDVAKAIHSGGGRDNLVYNNMLLTNTGLNLYDWGLRGVSTNIPLAVMDATNTPDIVITLSRPHYYVNGEWRGDGYYYPPDQKVFIQGVRGNTAANGSWQYQIVSPTQIKLIGSRGNGDYAGGGSSILDPVFFNSWMTNSAYPYFKVLYPKESLRFSEGDAGQPRGNEFVRNIVYKTKAVWGEHAVKWDNTLPFAIIRDNVFDQDPLFEDYASGNFRLRPESPALALGFKQLPFEQMGIFANSIVGAPPPGLTDSGLGDVTGDGQIMAEDAWLVARYAVELVKDSEIPGLCNGLTAEEFRRRGDVDGVAGLSANDAMLIAKRAVGLIDRFPVEIA